MACCKYIVKNISNQVTTFNYLSCNKSIWYYEVELNPGESKEVFLYETSYSTQFKGIEIVNKDCNLVGDLITRTVTPTSTVTPSITTTSTQTSTNTQTPTLTPTNSQTPTLTPTKTQTPTVTRTQTQTPTVTRTQTQTVTITQTKTMTQTPTRTTTQTPTITRTPTRTMTQTPTHTTTQTPTITRTPTITPTQTTTQGLTPMLTKTTTQTTTPTLTPTITPTKTTTPTLTPTKSVTPTTTTTQTPTTTSCVVYVDLQLVSPYLGCGHGNKWGIRLITQNNILINTNLTVNAELISYSETSGPYSYFFTCTIPAGSYVSNTSYVSPQYCWDFEYFDSFVIDSQSVYPTSNCTFIINP